MVRLTGYHERWPDTLLLTAQRTSRFDIEVDFDEIASFWDVPRRWSLPNFPTLRLAPICFFVAILRGNLINKFPKFVNNQLTDEIGSSPMPTDRALAGGR
jgi:hypothetical protein